MIGSRIMRGVRSGAGNMCDCGETLCVVLCEPFGVTLCVALIDSLLLNELVAVKRPELPSLSDAV